MKACKETKPLSLCLLFVVLAVPSAQAQWIASVLRPSNSPPVIASTPLAEGSRCYNDRDYTYASVPTALLGAQYVQVSNNDKFTAPYTLRLTMSANATLYLFLDNCLGNGVGGPGVDPILPPQMSWVTTLGFTDTGLDIGIDESDAELNNFFSVFSKQVNAGDVIALGVQNAGPWNMYTVAATPGTTQPIASVLRPSRVPPAIAPAPLTERWQDLGVWHGSLCYVDREKHIYASVPTEILGAQYVQVSQDEKTATDYHLVVTMSADATLYLFLDNRLGGGGQGVGPIIPSQMSWVTDLGFTDTGLDMGIDENADESINQYFSVFCKQVNAGDVIGLGPQADGGARNMYAVAAMPSTTPRATNPSPANMAIDVPTDVVLSWTPGMYAGAHDVYLGTVFEDVDAARRPDPRGVLVSQNQMANTYAPILEYGQTYYWRIDEVSAPPDSTIFLGNVWSFTTEGQGEGSILFEYFWGTDWSLESLLNLPTFPDSPDQSELRTSLEGSINWKDHYGTLVRGYLYPPQTGSYTFWIASDDQSQLWLSTDENPANAALIASVEGWVPPRDFDNTGGGTGGPEQKSGEITLEGGTRYYVEVLHSEGGGGDNLAVAWQGPSIPTRAVISGTFLSPWIRDIDLKANNPSPPDGATLVATDVTLTWEPGIGATSHHIYFGTNQADVATGTVDTDKGARPETSYSPPGGLAYGTTYYWRIDEFDGTTTHKGYIWSFTTTGILAPPISIPTDTSVGTWDDVHRIYTLTQDVPQSIQIDEDNLTLDGAGHRVIGPGSGNGVDLFGRTGVTLTNLRVSEFQFGIHLWACSNCDLIGNTCTSNNEAGIQTVSSVGNKLINNTCRLNGSYGININNSDSSTLTGNRNEWNTYFGIHLYYANGNTLTGNTNNSNDRGITLYGSEGNTLRGNACQSNRWVGIHLYSSTGNTMESNTYNSNDADGIFLENSTGNALTNNTVSNNGGCGIQLIDCSGNQIYNNNLISNPVQAVVQGSSSGNVFNLDKPSGGNFWSDWTAPDADQDRIVDSPYVFSGGQDNLPWTRQDYWLSADSDGVSDGVEDGAPNGGDGNGDGVLDSAQDNVTSLPNAADGQYVTLVSPEGTEVQNVTAGGNPSPDDAPPGVEFPVGFFDFAVSGMGVGGSATVTILLPAGVTFGTYYKYGPTPEDPTSHWYQFLYDGTTGAEILSDRVILHFVDGLRGDNDLTANGQIVDPGAPAAIQVVGIDIKPGSYPNSFNNDAHGVIPVAILGGASFDVRQIDVSTLRFEGLALRMKANGDYQFSIKDVSGKFSNTMNGEPDGYPDLVCQFVDEDGVWNQGESIATVRGELSNGAPFMGTDSVKITQ
jgi:parallel beta-helix repeat protein